jgi:glycogen synthase
MNVLIYSRAFWPNIGGVETMMEILAEEFTAARHRVTVVTLSKSEVKVDFGYEIIRSPGVLGFVKELRKADVCLCAGLSARALGPLLLARTPFVVSHHGSYGTPGDFSALAEIKKSITKITSNVCCSQAVQATIPGRSIVIPNTYRSEIFRHYEEVSRDSDIVFVGRLVSDKGVLDLLEAVARIATTGKSPRLSIVGEGPELSAIRAKVAQLDLGTLVQFMGVMKGADLAKFIARHQIMAVPSRWPEPFGVVALEGIACGCVIVGTKRGGLPEAIGPCGITVRNGDIAGLAQALKNLLASESLRAWYRKRAPEHLSAHSRRAIAVAYLEALKSTI